jgi:hypothetical protein
VGLERGLSANPRCLPISTFKNGPPGGRGSVCRPGRVNGIPAHREFYFAFGAFFALGGGLNILPLAAALFGGVDSLLSPLVTSIVGIPTVSLY